MTFREALERLGGPVIGLTSLIACVINRTLDPIAGQVADPAQDAAGLLERARGEEQRLQRAMEQATSDAAYWGYAGQASYWKAVRMVAEAAVLRGDLPDVPTPPRGGVVMDEMAALERFGEEVLRRSRERQP